MRKMLVSSSEEAPSSSPMVSEMASDSALRDTSECTRCMATSVSASSRTTAKPVEGGESEVMASSRGDWLLT